MPQQARWIVTFAFTEQLEGIQATVYSCKDDERRNVLRTLVGPFDDPTDILSTIIELLDHAYWSGEQLALLDPALSE